MTVQNGVSRAVLLCWRSKRDTQQRYKAQLHMFPFNRNMFFKALAGGRDNFTIARDNFVGNIGHSAKSKGQQAVDHKDSPALPTNAQGQAPNQGRLTHSTALLGPIPVMGARPHLAVAQPCLLATLNAF